MWLFSWAPSCLSSPSWFPISWSSTFHSPSFKPPQSPSPPSIFHHLWKQAAGGQREKSWVLALPFWSINVTKDKDALPPNLSSYDLQLQQSSQQLGFLGAGAQEKEKKGKEERKKWRFPPFFLSFRHSLPHTLSQN